MRTQKKRVFTVWKEMAKEKRRTLKLVSLKIKQTDRKEMHSIINEWRRLTILRIKKQIEENNYYINSVKTKE